jgi:hypothetical protein
MRTIAYALGTLSLAAAPLAAQTVAADLDTDGNGRVSPEEWSAYRSGDPERGAAVWSAYDTDRSGDVTPEEHAAGEFARLDRNADSMLDEAEYSASFSMSPPLASEGAAGEVDAEPGATATGSDDEAAELSGYASGMADYDQDGDSLLNPGEFSASLSGLAEHRAAYSRYDEDQDGLVSREEFDRAEFRRVDADGDGVLSEEEIASVIENQQAEGEAQ